jgi:hypothetical protein
LGGVLGLLFYLIVAITGICFKGFVAGLLLSITGGVTGALFGAKVDNVKNRSGRKLDHT